MNKICTSLEQSKKLIELGIDVNTADLTVIDLPIQGGDRFKFISSKLPNDTFSSITDGKSEKIPAWSVSALLDLMPPYLFEFDRGIDLNIYPNLSGKTWHCSYMPNAVENMKHDKFKQITNGDDLIDAVFEMVVRLKENKMI